MTKTTGAILVAVLLGGCAIDGDDPAADAGAEADSSEENATVLGRWVVFASVAPCGADDRQRLDFTLRDDSMDWVSVSGWDYIGGSFTFDADAPSQCEVDIHIIGSAGAEERWGLSLSDDGIEASASLVFWRDGCTVEDGNVTVVVRER